jgi:hypothetical protein
MAAMPRRVLPKLPVLKVYGLLALLTAAYVLLLVMFDQLPQGSSRNDPLLGPFLLWVGVSVTAGGLAIIAAVVRYIWLDPPRPVTYPGFVTGALYLLFFAVSALMR